MNEKLGILYSFHKTEFENINFFTDAVNYKKYLLMLHICLKKQVLFSVFLCIDELEHSKDFLYYVVLLKYFLILLLPFLFSSSRINNIPPCDS